jgi:hypothetical protein
MGTVSGMGTTNDSNDSTQPAEAIDEVEAALQRETTNRQDAEKAERDAEKAAKDAEKEVEKAAKDADKSK